MLPVTQACQLVLLDRICSIPVVPPLLTLQLSRIIIVVSVCANPLKQEHSPLFIYLFPFS